MVDTNIKSLLKGLSESAAQQAQEFLKIAPNFMLGILPTEQPAPETIGMSEKSQKDLQTAIGMLKTLDLKTINILLNKIPQLESMYNAVSETLLSGKKIFICGCGSTGRLSLALEALWRQEVTQQFQKQNPQVYNELIDRVVSFMAGGDVALIKSVEDFEDHPEFAEQQMRDLGYTVDDLLIASTEGGETPWVIGATQFVEKQSQSKPARMPYFLYCNPDDVLMNIERSRNILQNKFYNKINLFVGNMGLTGSTRMQSTTILMYAIGLALFGYFQFRGISKEQADKTFVEYSTKVVQNFLKNLETFDEVAFIHDFTVKESQIYKENNFIFYKTNQYFALSILTDTTERSPTFSLFPFENQQDIHLSDFNPSLCHLVMMMSTELPKDTDQAVNASWYDMLGGRDIRSLEGKYWEKYKNKVSLARALGHDFSTNLIEKRKTYCKKALQYDFTISKDNGQLVFRLERSLNKDEQVNEAPMTKSTSLNVFENRRLDEHIFLKILLNTHSTLVMGRLQRYESNLMTWVRPSNNKLIDRAIRYIMHLLAQKKESFVNKNPQNWEKINYEFVCHALFSEVENLQYGQAIVLKTFQRIVNDLFDNTYKLDQQL